MLAQRQEWRPTFWVVVLVEGSGLLGLLGGWVLRSRLPSRRDRQVKVQPATSTVPAPEAPQVEHSAAIGALRRELEQQRRRLGQAQHTLSESRRELHHLRQSFERLQQEARALGDDLFQLEPSLQDVCGRLQGLLTRTESDVMRVVEHLSRIHTSSQEQVARIAEIAHEVQLVAQGNRELEVVEQKIRDYLEAQLTRTREELRQLHQLVDEARQLQPLVDQIDSIARQTHLLALNATIEATRAGEAGRSFAVVAGEVQKLSERTRTIAASIDRQVSQVTHRLQEKIGQLSTLMETNAQELQELQQASRQIEQALRENNQRISSLVDVVEQVNSNQVVARLSETLGAIQFQDVARQELEQVIKVLQKVAGYLLEGARWLQEPLERSRPRPPSGASGHARDADEEGPRIELF